MRSKHRAAAIVGLSLVPISLLSAGCHYKDADRLASLGAKLAKKAEALFTPGAGGAMRGWQSMPLWGDGALDARVLARLNSDKGLSETSIQVQVIGGVVELHGKVRDMDQKRRAFELAQTTLGVEKVLDRLEIGP